MASPDMDQHIPISVMVFTLNEEINIPYCLESVSWSDDVVIIDSGSEDRTVDIARQYGARVIHQAFTGFGSVRNWGLAHANLKNDWVLILDADERVPELLAIEMGERLGEVAADVAAFRVRRRFHMWGRWLRRSSLYPTWVVRLVRKGRVEYVDRGHAETQNINGVVLDLREDIVDENHKGLENWFERQNRYSTQDARYELKMSGRSNWWKDLFTLDPLARRTALKTLSSWLPFRSFYYFFYSYVFRGGFLEGRYGLWLCLLRAQYYFMVQLKKRELARDMQGDTR